MPVRTRNGLVHAVEEPAGSGYYGRAVCGLIYQRKEKRGTWKTEGPPHGTRVYRVKPTSKRPTCLACMCHVRTTYPWA